ncbi:uncharacterized protein LOC120635674 isoform X3 [Pararge aegeria]|uniref:uncharacterized protein LOC120635674 isoform X3 n=1 Tax=Pararge aegeria TaxID=116150 RepID=UPI0019D1C317|nr:uncharacterized protein LOC120635674 isoform X3 [Pararge aegeria]
MAPTPQSEDVQRAPKPIQSLSVALTFVARGRICVARMPSCVVRKCTNSDKKSNRKKDGVSFFRLPAEPHRRKLWYRLIRRQRGDPLFKAKKSHRICSAHFNDTDYFVTLTGLRKLYTTAIPHLVDSVASGASIASDDESTYSDDHIDDRVDDPADDADVSNYRGELEEVVIKEEVTEEEEKQCRLCLSFGRRMQELGDLAHFYRKLVFENLYQNSTIPRFMFEMLACWECIAELRRVRRFQQRVRRANEAFESNQNLSCDSLSNLSVVATAKVASGSATDQPTSIEDCAQIIKEETCVVNFQKTALADPLAFNKESVNPKKKVRMNQKDPKKRNIRKSSKNLAQVKKTAVKRPVTEKKKPQSKPKRARIEDNAAEKPEEPSTSTEERVSSVIIDSDTIFGKVKIEFEELQNILEERRKKETFVNMKYKCDSCVLGFSNENRLQEHNTNFHNEEAGSCPCDVCDRRFSDEIQLSAHYRTHFVKFVCKLCNFECFTKTGRAMHFKRHQGVLEGIDANSLLWQKITSQATASSCE